jgi:FKBP-type peptidyl-prolyl cis-trans isomerase
MIRPHTLSPLFLAATLLATSCFAQDNKDATKPATPDAAKVEIKVTAEGDSVTKDGDILFVLYTGKLKDGTVFDSTDKHGGKPFQFTLGKGNVIKGWEQGCLGMKVGEKRTLIIPPSLGYGASGSGPIPANSTLTFDIQLAGFVRLPKTDAPKD